MYEIQCRNSFKNRKLLAGVLMVVTGLVTLTIAGDLASATTTRVTTRQPVNMNLAFGADGPIFWEQNGGDAEWYYTNGTLEINATVVRQVKVWAATDGRYRVRTTSADGSGAAEEIAYDGHGNQLVLIKASNSALPTAAVVRNRFHYAVTGLENGNDVHYRGQAVGNVLIQESAMQDSNAMRYTAGNVALQRGDAAILTVAIPDGVEVSNGLQAEDESHASSSATTSSTSGPRTQDLLDLYFRPCMRAYNYRNSVSNLFLASSRVTSDQTQDHHCKWVHVAAWSGVAGYANSWCDLTAFVGSSRVRSDYTFWLGYFEVTSPHPRDKACSSHAAWDQYWIPHITAAYLTAAVHG